MPKTFEAGTKVVFTQNRLGLVATRTATRGFEDKTVNAGDEGVYDRPHPTIPDWHMIKVGEQWCPCHESHFEVSSLAEKADA